MVFLGKANVKRSSKFVAIFSCNFNRTQLIAPLHSAGIWPTLHACGRKRARTLLTGICNGTLADTRRQAQSTLVVIKDRNESQHVADGVKPLLMLPVMKLAQGVIVLIIEVVQGVVITCAVTKFSEVKIARANNNMSVIWELELRCPMGINCQYWQQEEWWVV